MRIGIDLGGTKIEAIALADDGTQVVRRRIPAPRGDYTATLKAIVSLVAGIERETGASGTVGVGTPGALSPASGLLRNSNSVWLNGTPFDVDLAEALQRPVRIANDANCFALSEATDGAAAGGGTVFGVILGTGVGGAIVVRGQVLEGANRIAGEWGHNAMPWPAADELPGESCYCGLRGCIETLLSGPALEREHERRTGTQRRAEEIALAAGNGDGDAAAVLDRYEDRLARALASVINVIDPDIIVLGGGLSNIARLYDGVRHRWERYVFSDVVRTELRKALHGDASGVRGAAWL